MSKETEYRAVWSSGLTVVTFISVGVSAGVMVLGRFFLPGHAPMAVCQAMFYMPPLVLMACLPFTVRGYAITEDFLLIRRLGWSTSLRLEGVRSVEIDPTATNGSIRLWGSGGLFGFFGWFRNKKLGIYHAYATNLEQAVVIKFARRTVVVTPDDPARFAAEMKRHVG